MSTVPTPLPASSPLLARKRVEAEVMVPHPTRAGSWQVIATGRFVTPADARAWADAVHPDQRIRLGFYSERTGWRAEDLGGRIDGKWLDR